MILTIILVILGLVIVIAGALIQNRADVAKMNGVNLIRKTRDS